MFNARITVHCVNEQILVSSIQQWSLPGDVALASFEKLANQKDSNAQLSPDMFHNDS